MNKKMKKGIFWGVVIASSVLVINILHGLFAGNRDFARRPHGHGPGEMGPGGAFGPHQMMVGHHHEGGFPWLFLFIGLAVLFFLIRWLRKKAKTSSMKQFIDTSLVSSHIPVNNQNASLLDQWEKNLMKKKENE